MIKISELRGYLKDFESTSDRIEEHNVTAQDFVDFVESEQKTAKKGGVVPINERIAYARLKNIEEQQASQRQIDPENDMDNL